MVLLTEKAGRVLKITLNRPDRGNSLDISTLFKLHDIVFQSQKMDNINVILLTGSGTKDFCTGIDIKSASVLSLEDRVNLANVAGNIATQLYFGKPSVVAANGRAMGMGIVFACAADYAIINKEAVCQMPEINVGIFPGASCIAIMNRKLGIRKTAEILMLGNQFSAQKSVEYGIFNQIAEFGELMEIALEYAKSLSRKTANLLKILKIAINSANDLNFNSVLKIEEAGASWANWKDPDSIIENIIKEHEIMPKFLGDIKKLKDFIKQNP